MDLSFLRPVYEHAGPFASVYLDVSRDAEDADKAINVRWRDAREKLADRGADEASLRALDAVIGNSEGEPGATGQIAFAANGKVVFDRLVGRPPQDQTVHFGPLPQPMPYLLRRGQHVPYTLVVVDTFGADIHSVDLTGTASTFHVAGEDYPTHKPHGGAEAHKHMQRAVDERVKGNAHRVANELQHLAVGGGSKIIAVAGDVQVRQALIHQISHGLEGRIVELESGSRAAGSASSPLDRELHGVLDEYAGKQVGSVMDAYERGRAAPDGADRVTEGLESTVAALRRGQVDTLLWNPGPWIPNEDESGLWVGPAAEQVATSEGELVDTGVSSPQRERVDAAVVRATVGTSANLVLVSDEEKSLTDGVGALLRFDDPALAD